MKNKAVAIFLVFWGVVFFFYGAVYLIDYYLTGWTNTPLVETVIWLVVDVALVLSGITLWVIATKILTEKS